MNDDPLPKYYTASEVRQIRNSDRKSYRRGVVFLFAYMVAVVVPFRIGFDLLVRQHKFHAQFLEPYGPFIIAGLAITMLAVGLRNVFKLRR